MNFRFFFSQKWDLWELAILLAHAALLSGSICSELKTVTPSQGGVKHGWIWIVMLKLCFFSSTMLVLVSSWRMGKKMQTQFLAATKIQFAMREGSIAKRYQFYEKVIRKWQHSTSFLVFQLVRKKRFMEEIIYILCFAILQMNNLQ